MIERNLLEGEITSGDRRVIEETLPPQSTRRQIEFALRATAGHVDYEFESAQARDDAA